MANKKKNVLQKRADKIKKQARQLHDTTLAASDNLVEASLSNGARWQKVMAKAAKNGTILFGKQQEMALDTLEMLKDHWLHGNKRFKKLLGFKAPSLAKAVEEVAKPAAAKVKAVKDTSVMAKEIAKARIKKAKKKLKAASAKSDVRKTASAKKAVVKKTVAKNAAKIKGTSKAKTRKTTTKDDFTLIKGIGPKIAELLHKEGIRTFADLAKTNVKTLKAILEKAGPRYARYNPQSWSRLAKKNVIFGLIQQ